MIVEEITIAAETMTVEEAITAGNKGRINSRINRRINKQIDKRRRPATSSIRALIPLPMLHCRVLP
jgi:hypothetical protein